MDPISEVPNPSGMENLLNAGLSKGKIQSMQNYAQELRRKNPKLKPDEVKKKVASKYGIQFK